MAQHKIDNPALYKRTRTSIPAGGMGSVDEIAEVARFRASPHAG